jgi:hypothetical protein
VLKLADDQPRRTVHQHEALAWLAENPAEPGSSVITSLPDVSELPECDFEAWRSWFLTAVGAVLSWVPADGLAIFFQTDVLHGGAWVDKSFLVLSAAAASGHSLVWHKIVCTTPPGEVSAGRPGYSHLVCLAPAPLPAFRHPLPDVLPDGGSKTTQKSMGLKACALACRFVLAATPARVVVDPFCGTGSVLAVANALGIDAVGIDRSPRACRAARSASYAID